MSSASSPSNIADHKIQYFFLSSASKKAKVVECIRFIMIRNGYFSLGYTVSHLFYRFTPDIIEDKEKVCP